MPSDVSLPTTIDGWVDYTQTLHGRSIDMTLDRVRQVRDRMGLDNLPFRAVAIAGTNGKGSTVATLESIYAEAGYRTAAYTSPHLVRYNERIRIAGADVDDESILEGFRRVEAARGDVTLTYFEFGTLAAVDIIRRSNVDVALLEVGLGGRLDAVRCFDAIGSIVTSIGLDHQDWLGDTRESVGHEKAGIGIPGRPMVCADPDPPETIALSARDNGVILYQRGAHYDLRVTGDTWSCWRADGARYDALPHPGIAGAHQHSNAAGCLTLIDLLQDQLPVAEAAIHRGLAGASLTARLEIIGRSPLRIVDVAHNVQAAHSLVTFLNANPVSGRTLMVFGMLGDKPVEGVTRLLEPLVDVWFVAGLDVDRGTDAQSLLARMIDDTDPAKLRAAHDPVAAWAAAVAEARPDDRVIAFGSFHTVGDILRATRDRSTVEVTSQ